MAEWPHSTTAASADVRVGKAAYSSSDSGTDGFVLAYVVQLLLMASRRHATAPAEEMKDFVKTIISVLQYSVPDYDAPVVGFLSFNLNWPTEAREAPNMMIGCKNQKM